MTRIAAALLPWVMRRSLRHGLAGVWGRSAPLPDGGAVVVSNHASWWDGYLHWFVATRAQRSFGLLIDASTLERFPFFRRLGGMAPFETRRAARRARAGAWVVVYPEGALTPTGALAPFARGAEAISRWAGVPIVPVATRVVMRGRQRPEAYVSVGAPLVSGTPAHRQRACVAQLLAAIDRDLEAADDPEAPPGGFDAWLVGVRSTDERAARFRRWWS